MIFGIKLFRRNRIGCLRILLLVSSCFVIFWLMKNIIFATGDDISSIQYIEELDMEEQSKNPRKLWAKTRDESVDPPSTPPIVIEQSHVDMEESHVDVKELSETIKKLNNEQKILNVWKFLQRTEHSIIIVVQVHKRGNYLKKLIESLSNTRGISDALLIFSHDYVSDEINNIVRVIDFCQVMQIYFPYSQQLHPNEFPGTDPNDCPRDKLVDGCNNAQHPDMYGHFREAKYTMTKHHWWWKANRIFHGLDATLNHKGLVLFLEEDHYVAPDFYQVLQKAYSMKKTSQECQEMGCDIITLGDYRKLYSYEADRSNVMEIRPWKSAEHNMGMAFDRETWDKMSKCSKMFCTYDDYNWDWTLMKMSTSCFNRSLTVLLVKDARVFHVGTCGLHHKTGSCDVEQIIGQVKNVVLSGAKFLYPNSLIIHIARPWLQGHTGQPNGGWGDTRDHDLCLHFSQLNN